LNRIVDATDEMAAKWRAGYGGKQMADDTREEDNEEGLG